MKEIKVKKYELIQPKTGQTHRLFGPRYLKRHKMRDPRWTADHKIAQYLGVAKLYELDQDLNELKDKLEGEYNLELLKKLKNDLKEKENAEQKKQQKSRQLLKNMMSHDKYMQRYYPNVDPHKLVDRIQNRTFLKQKILDKLTFEQRQLVEKYQSRLVRICSEIKEIAANLFKNFSWKCLNSKIASNTRTVLSLKTLIRSKNFKLKSKTLRQDLGHMPKLNKLTTI